MDVRIGGVQRVAQAHRLGPGAVRLAKADVQIGAQHATVPHLAGIDDDIALVGRDGRVRYFTQVIDPTGQALRLPVPPVLRLGEPDLPGTRPGEVQRPIIGEGKVDRPVIVEWRAQELRLSPSIRSPLHKPHVVHPARALLAGQRPPGVKVQPLAVRGKAGIGLQHVVAKGRRLRCRQLALLHPAGPQAVVPAMWRPPRENDLLQIGGDGDIVLLALLDRHDPGREHLHLRPGRLLAQVEALPPGSGACALGRGVEPDLVGTAGQPKGGQKDVQVAIPIQVGQVGVAVEFTTAEAEPAVDIAPRAIVEPDLVGLLIVGQHQVEVAVAVQISETGVTIANRGETLAAVGELPAPVVHQDQRRMAGRLEMPVGDHGIQVAIPVHVSQAYVTDGHGRRIGVEPALAEAARPVVEQGPVPGPLLFDKQVHVAVAIQITPDGGRGKGPLPLGALGRGEVAYPIVQVDRRGLYGLGQRIEVAVPIQVRQVQAVANVHIVLAAVLKPGLAVVQVHLAGPGGAVTGEEQVQVAIPVQIADVNAVPVLHQLLARIGKGPIAVVEPDLGIVDPAVGKDRIQVPVAVQVAEADLPGGQRGKDLLALDKLERGFRCGGRRRTPGGPEIAPRAVRQPYRIAPLGADQIDLIIPVPVRLEGDPLPVRRPVRVLVHRPRRLGQPPHLAPISAHHVKVLPVGLAARLAAEIGDLGPVGRPGREQLPGLGIGQPLLVAPAGVRHVQVQAPLPVGGKRDLAPVRRPVGPEPVLDQELQAAAVGVDDPHIPLEIEPRIKTQPVAVGVPGGVVGGELGLRHPALAAAIGVDEIELVGAMREARPRLRVVPVGDKGDLAAIGRKRRRCVLELVERQAHLLAAVGPHRVELGIAVPLRVKDDPPIRGARRLGLRRLGLRRRHGVGGGRPLSGNHNRCCHHRRRQRLHRRGLDRWRTRGNRLVRSASDQQQ